MKQGSRHLQEAIRKRTILPTEGQLRVRSVWTEQIDPARFSTLAALLFIVGGDTTAETKSNEDSWEAPNGSPRAS